MDPVESLSEFSHWYKKRLALFRTKLAEMGFECSYPELQGILADMNELGIEATQDSVVEFIKKSRKEKG